MRINAQYKGKTHPHIKGLFKKGEICNLIVDKQTIMNYQQTKTIFYNTLEDFLEEWTNIKIIQ